MAEANNLKKPILTGAEPQLFVADIQASCDFFTRVLGFEVAFTYGEPPFYAQVFRDAARLNLRHVDASPFAGAVREREDLLSAVITLNSVDGIQALFHEVRGSRRALAPGIAAGALGCSHLYRQGSGRKPAAIRRAGRAEGLGYRC